MKLTKATVKELKLPAGKAEALVFDDDLSGFGLRLRAGGKRTWVIQYRVGQKQRRVTLGSADAIDADRARKEAKDMLAKVQLGGDPQVEKHLHREKAALTLGVVGEKYLSVHGERNLGARTLVEVRRALRTHWAPLAEVPMDKLTKGTISAQLDEIALESGPFAANRARAYLSALFNWAVRRGYAEDNPVRLTGRAAPEVSRDRVLADWELGLIWRHAGAGDYGDVVRLLILTGQRREEVGGMAWSELDLDKGLWTIPGTRTKNARIHEVPLSEPALAILHRRRRIEGRDLVFGTGSGGFSGFSRAKTALDARIYAAIKAADPKVAPMQSWRLHDLRRSAITGMANLGVLPHVVEAIANHQSGSKVGVAGVYNRASYSIEKRAALDIWAAHLSNSNRKTISHAPAID